MQFRFSSFVLWRLLWKCAHFPRPSIPLSHNLEISLEIEGFSGIKSQITVTAFHWTLVYEVECLMLSTCVMQYSFLTTLRCCISIFPLTTEKMKHQYSVWLTQIRTAAAYPDRSPSHANKVTLIIRHCLLVKKMSMLLCWDLWMFNPACIWLAWRKYQNRPHCQVLLIISFNDKTRHMKLTEMILAFGMISNHFMNLTAETNFPREHCFSNTWKHLGNDFWAD